MKRLAFLALLLFALVGCKRAKPKNATHVWLGARHGCATWTNGETACWGANEKGQLGTNDHTDSQLPLAVPGISPPLEMELGSDWTCAEYGDAGAGARCWGSRTTPPTLQELMNGIEGLGRSQIHRCDLGSDRVVRCSGKNDSGQLGDGTRRDSDTPVGVYGLHDVAEVGTGRRHSCARLLNGTVSCWGANDRHQLANGTTEASSRPVAIFGLTGVKQLAVAGDGACALLSDGELRCWGANELGQLGDGTKVDHDVPAPVRSPR